MTDYKKYNMCERKIRYRKQLTALKELKSIARTGKIIPPNAHAYKCPYCDGWHLGHNKLYY